MAEKTNDKIAAIFEATLALISEQGLHATPMSQIADKAKIGMGTIYHYFPSKENLINALYLDIKAKMLGILKATYDARASVEESVKQLLHAVITYYVAQPSSLYFAEQCENSPIITESTKEEGMRSAGPLLELFCRAKQENLLKELPLDVLGALLMGAVISLTKLCLSGAVEIGSPSFDASLDAIWDMLRR